MLYGGLFALLADARGAAGPPRTRAAVGFSV